LICPKKKNIAKPVIFIAIKISVIAFILHLSIGYGSITCIYMKECQLKDVVLQENFIAFL
jgi:hypothetical protein